MVKKCACGKPSVNGECPDCQITKAIQRNGLTEGRLLVSSETKALHSTRAKGATP